MYTRSMKTPRILIFSALFALCCSLAVASYAHSQPEPAPDVAMIDAAVPTGDIVPVVEMAEVVNPAKEDPAGVGSEVYDKLRDGDWLMAFAGVLMFLVWGLRPLLSRWVKWFDTKLGGIALAFGTAFLLSLATAVWAGQSLSIGLVVTAATAAWAAAGARKHLKDFLSRKNA